MHFAYNETKSIVGRKPKKIVRSNMAHFQTFRNKCKQINQSEIVMHEWIDIVQDK